MVKRHEFGAANNKPAGWEHKVVDENGNPIPLKPEPQQEFVQTRLNEDLAVEKDESPEFKPDPEEVAPLSEAEKAAGSITLEGTQALADSMAAQDKEKENELLAKLNQDAGTNNPPPAEGDVKFDAPKPTARRRSTATPPPVDDAERAKMGLAPLEAPGMKHKISVPPPLPAEAASTAPATAVAEAKAAVPAVKPDDNFELAVPMPDSAKNRRRAPRAKAATPPPLPPEAAPVPPPMPPAPRATRRNGPPPLDAAERARAGLPPLERPIGTPPPLPPEAAPVLPPLPPIANPRINAAEILARYPQPKPESGTKKFFKALAWPVTAPTKKIAGWLGFNANRAGLNTRMGWESKAVQGNLVVVEKAKAKHGQADAVVKDLERQLGVLNGLAAADTQPVTPKEAVRRQKERNKLEAQLQDARTRLGERLLGVNNAEARAINHENKRAEIARQYAELVDNRIAPIVLEREAFNVEKQKHENEIATWRGACDGYANDIQRLELLAQENPAVRSTFRMQIKEARRLLSNSQKQLAERVFGLEKIDERLTKVNGIISGWELKKKHYQDIADKRMDRSGIDPNVIGDQQSSAGFRDPVARTSSNPVAAREAAVNAATAGFEARESAPEAYNVNEWIQNWNDMHGTRLELNLQAMVDDGVPSRFLRNPPDMNALQFDELVKVYMRRHKLRTGQALDTKVKPKDVAAMAKATFDRMQERAAA